MSDGRSPFDAPVVQLLTGDDQADTAAAAWSGAWGRIWAPASVGVRRAQEAVALHPSLVVVGIPIAGGGQFVTAAVDIAARCDVPVACVPWYLGDLVDVRRTRVGRSVLAAVSPELDRSVVIRQAERVAIATGQGVTVVELEGAPEDHAATAASLAAAEHLASLLVVGLDPMVLDGPGTWAAVHTIAPTLLVPAAAVPTARATAPRTRPPGSAVPSPASPAGLTRSS